MHAFFAKLWRTIRAKLGRPEKKWPYTLTKEQCEVYLAEFNKRDLHGTVFSPRAFDRLQARFRRDQKWVGKIMPAPESAEWDSDGYRLEKLTKNPLVFHELYYGNFSTAQDREPTQFTEEALNKALDAVRKQVQARQEYDLLNGHDNLWLRRNDFKPSYGNDCSSFTTPSID